MTSHLRSVSASISEVKVDNCLKGMDEHLMRDCIRLVSATKSPKTACTFELDIDDTFSNRMGNMHGGVVALVFDMATTMCAAPLARRDFWWFGGVSRHLSVTYMRPVKLGMTVQINCEVLQMGQRLATIRGEFRDKADGRVLCVCEHNKASIKFEEKSVLC
jgi:acyl-coenzyme A thioesterase 13